MQMFRVVYPPAANEPPEFCSSLNDCAKAARKWYRGRSEHEDEAVDKNEPVEFLSRLPATVSAAEFGADKNMVLKLIKAAEADDPKAEILKLLDLKPIGVLRFKGGEMVYKATAGDAGKESSGDDATKTPAGGTDAAGGGDEAAPEDDAGKKAA